MKKFYLNGDEIFNYLLKHIKIESFLTFKYEVPLEATLRYGQLGIDL